MGPVGPRIQSVLEHTVKSLHEYNSHPDTSEDRQCTILDGLRLLSDLEFRRQVLRRVADSYIVGWWERDFVRWSRTLQADAIAPVQTRLAYYLLPAALKPADKRIGHIEAPVHWMPLMNLDNLPYGIPN